MRLHTAALVGLALLMTSFTPGDGGDRAAPPDRVGAAVNPDVTPPGDVEVDVAGGAEEAPEVAEGPLEAPEAPDRLALPDNGPPAAPADPAALAAVLTAAEQAIRDPGRPPAELEAAGHWQQVAYRALVAERDWVGAVLAAMPADLHLAVRGNLFAGARLAAMDRPADPDRPRKIRPLPSWRIVQPPPADELKSHYEAAQAATGVHWTYLAAVNLVETRMGRIRGESPVGAQGPMQFMPATWAEWGEGSVHDHRDAIMAAARYLRWGGMPGDVNGALFRYNRDTRYVDAVRTHAEVMQRDPRAYYGYYHWQVYYNTRADHVWLAPGYDGTS